MEKIKGLSAYLISTNGEIKNICSGKIYTHCKDRAGYLRVFLTDDKGKRRGYSVHRLIALAYIDNPENKPCVNHKDGDKSNNSIDNLEWCTHRENTKHAREELNVKFGTQKGKLRNRAIYEMSKIFTQDEISNIFGCSQSNINRILKNFKEL